MKQLPLLLMLVLLAGSATAQTDDVLPAPSILRNGISVLEARGDTLWTGPFLSMTYDGDDFAPGERWFAANTEGLRSASDVVYSLDVEGDTLWAGLGFTSNEGVPTAAGFLVSTDGGRSFAYQAPPLDRTETPDQLDTLRYGNSTIAALPVTVPQQSPPYDLDVDPRSGTVWTAGWASGIRFSTDAGRSWHRAILPPDTLAAIHPDTASYRFILAPRVSEQAAFGNYNHQGFAVLVDEAGVVWAGTPAGLNRSTPDDVVAFADTTFRAWTRVAYDGTPRGLTGSWVTALAEQPRPGRNAVWIASWNADEVGEAGQDGITVTRDGGETFEQVLLGERIYDFAFRGDTVYAAGRRSGLLTSTDGGLTWQATRTFTIDRSLPGQADAAVPGTVQVFAVATTPEALWVGTSDGLFKSTDAGASWALYRTDVPLQRDAERDPAGFFADQPEVDTYAYPNPFAPSQSDVVRMKYDADGAAEAEVRIFDFGMNLVREFVHACPGGGVCEALWNGTDEAGIRVANGPYFYLIDTGDETVRGKILVLE